MSHAREDEDDPTEMIDPETLAELLALTRAKQSKAAPAPPPEAPSEGANLTVDASGASAASPSYVSTALLVALVVCSVGAVALYLTTL